MLVQNDPNKKLSVSRDTSPYGVGAVLSHKIENEKKRTIAFASRTFCFSEKTRTRKNERLLLRAFVSVTSQKSKMDVEYK